MNTNETSEGKSRCIMNGATGEIIRGVLTSAIIVVISEPLASGIKLGVKAAASAIGGLSKLIIRS